MCAMEQLSNEVVYKILEFVDIRDLYSLSLVCKRLHALCQDHSTWRRLTEADFCQSSPVASVAQILRTFRRCPKLSSLKIPVVSSDIVAVLSASCRYLRHLEIHVSSIDGLNSAVEALILNQQCAELKSFVLAAPSHIGLSTRTTRRLMLSLTKAATVSISGAISSFEVPIIPLQQQLPAFGPHDPLDADRDQVPQANNINANAALADDDNVDNIGDIPDNNDNAVDFLDEEEEPMEAELNGIEVVEATTALSVASCGLSSVNLTRMHRVYTELQSLSLTDITESHVLSFVTFTWPMTWARLTTVVLEGIASLRCVDLTCPSQPPLEFLTISRCPNLVQVTLPTCDHLAEFVISECYSVQTCRIESSALTVLHLDHLVAMSVLELRCVRLTSLSLCGCKQLTPEGVSTILNEHTLPLLRHVDASGCVLLKHQTVSALIAPWDCPAPDLDAIEVSDTGNTTGILNADVADGDAGPDAPGMRAGTLHREANTDAVWATDEHAGAGCHTLTYGGLGTQRVVVASWHLRSLHLHQLLYARDVIIFAPRLQQLSLEYPSRGIDINDVIQPLCGLRRIDVSSAKIIHADAVRTMCHTLLRLESITITNCGVEAMSFDSLPALKQLHVESCTGTNVAFTVRCCAELQRVCVDWSALQSIAIEECESLTEISCHGCRLESFTVRRCNALERVSQLSGPWSLHGVLKIRGADRLKALTLNRCPGLTDGMLERVLAECPQLREISITNCEQITKLALHPSVTRVCIHTCRRFRLLESRSETSIQRCPCQQSSLLQDVGTADGRLQHVVATKELPDAEVLCGAEKPQSIDRPCGPPGSDACATSRETSVAEFSTWPLSGIAFDHLPLVPMAAQLSWLQRCKSTLTDVTLRRLPPGTTQFTADFPHAVRFVLENCLFLTTLSVECPVLEEFRLGGCPKLHDVHVHFLSAAMHIESNPVASIKRLTLTAPTPTAPANAQLNQATQHPAFVYPDLIAAMCPHLELLSIASGSRVTQDFIEQLIQTVPTLRNVRFFGPAMQTMFQNTTLLPRFPIMQNDTRVVVRTREISTGRAFVFVLAACNRIQDLRVQVSARTGIPIDMAKLVYAGKYLSDHMLMRKINFHPSMPIHLVSSVKAKPDAALLPDSVKVEILSHPSHS
eukprot:m.557611 g.557611  ORF g.557611 m.557611 type:complete len:1144 (+) comp22191_c0_seq5:154-3585(+)